jgi:hypothetical protein
VLDLVARNLTYQPTCADARAEGPKRECRAPWELRIGDLRVYYEVKDDPERVVVVKAVGVKERNRVLIRGEEVKL